MTKWTITLEENPDNPEEVILQFPDDLLTEAGWAEGDTLKWIDNQDGTFILEKVK